MTTLEAPPNATPTDNLVRQRYDAGSIELREDDTGTGRTLNGHFAVFNEFTEIDSWFEGRFLEQIAPGSFRDTIEDENRSPKILFDHGHDPSIGNKPLGAPDVLREDKTGAYYESELFDEEYVNQLLPALRSGQLGASFRFRITSDEWREPKRSTKANPDKLKERTITGVDLYEFGPVTFPAYGNATAGVRSGSGDWAKSLMSDEDLLADYIERTGVNKAAHFLASLPAVGGREAPARNVPAVGGSEQATAQAQARAIARARASLLTR